MKYKRNRQYARFAETSDGMIIGQIENSFSMGYCEHYVNVDSYIRNSANPHDVKKLPHFATLQDTKKTVKIIRYFIVRVSRKNCEFEIDYSSRYRKSDKWYRRNLPFKIVRKTIKTDEADPIVSGLQ